MDWRKGQEIGLFSVEKIHKFSADCSRWTAGSPARFSWCKVWRVGSKHRRSTWKRVNDPQRSYVGSIIVGIYPLPSNSNSGGWKFFFGSLMFIGIFWWKCIIIRCMFCSSSANGHSIIERNSSAQRGRLEHSKCQTVCWICIWFDPFRASSALFQANSQSFDHEQHVVQDQSWFRVDFESLNRMYKHLW